MPALEYVHDGLPGWRRVRRGDEFSYIDQHGKPVRDPEALQRIRSLAVPPAYEHVWICPLADGHIQATARDARGRKQYRYHPLWKAQQGQVKFDRLRDFGGALPALRRRVRRDLARPGLPKDKVLAAMVRLLDTAYLRIGNDEYARLNGSFGLTTLRCRHAAVRGSVLKLAFRGKSGVPHEVEVADPQLSRIVRRCQALPGQLLFRYLDDAGQPCGIGSADVNAYLRAAAGEDFSAKDFRTWHASALALERLLALPAPQSQREARSELKRVISEVAAQLGHTPTVCKQSYVHQAVVERFTDGRLAALRMRRQRPAATLKAREKRLLDLLADEAASGSGASARRTSTKAAAPRVAR